MTERVQFIDPIQFVSVRDLLPTLKPLIEDVIQETLKRDLKEKLLSIEETRNLFSPKISRPTLQSLTGKGILKRYSLGGKWYYKYSEVISAATSYTKYRRQSI